MSFFKAALDPDSELERWTLQYSYIIYILALQLEITYLQVQQNPKHFECLHAQTIVYVQLLLFYILTDGLWTWQ